MAEKENVRAWRGWFSTVIIHSWSTFAWPLGVGWVNEVDAPFRHGRGLALRVWATRTLIIGRWWETSEERPGYRKHEVPRTPQQAWAHTTTRTDDDLDEDDFEGLLGVYVR